jgi:alanine racemase
LKLAFSHHEILSLLKPLHSFGELESTIELITIDTRTYCGEPNACFIALNGPFRKGLDFVELAYQKNIRTFILSEVPPILLEDALYFIVPDTLMALQTLAKAHREKFNLPILGICGKAGKTTVKEWLYELVKYDHFVVRSPKSYNSQIGVALSLFELHEQSTLGIIEMGISEPGEMMALLKMVQPTHCLITSWFNSDLDSQLSLAASSTNQSFNGKDQESHFNKTVLPFKHLIPFKDENSSHSAQMAIGLALVFNVSEEVLGREIPKLSRLALRLETFYGKNHSFILNDTYNLDLETLTVALQHMVSLAGNRTRCVYIGLDEGLMDQKPIIESLVRPFVQEHVYIGLPQDLPLIIPEDSIVLVKGTRKAQMERFATRFRAKQHQTVLEINVTNLRNNLAFYKSTLAEGTRLLAMVKAQSYGTGLVEMARILEAQGIDYLGVAYTSEGVSLRNNGVKLPILVLNPDPESYEECINHQLEPTVFTFAQLDRLIRDLIFHGAQQFPIHVEIDTGMRRLGFEPSEIKMLIERVKAQPEVRLKSVFTHFIESENLTDTTPSLQQIEVFTSVRNTVLDAFSYPVLFHMANSDAILNFPEAHFDMVRVGLGMFGVSHSSSSTLEPVLAWKSKVSQIKTVHPGESVSYGRSFIATQDTSIAILPIGYADGFPRRLSNGVGMIKIRGVWCPTVGKVCMDMLMVDVSTVPDAAEGDEAVLFDDVPSLLELARRIETIPYELMTGISERVHRIYIQN